MVDPYNLDLTAAQINTTLNNAWDVDNPPVANSGKLVNSHNIHGFVTGLVGDEITARENADTALEGVVQNMRLSMSLVPYSHLDYRVYANNVVFGNHTVTFYYIASKVTRTESFQFALKDVSGTIRSSVYSGSVSVANSSDDPPVQRSFSVTLNLSLNSGLLDLQPYRFEIVLGEPIITSIVQNTLNTFS